MQGWTDISVAKLGIVNLSSIKEKLKQNLKKHSTAFAQVRVLLRFVQSDG